MGKTRGEKSHKIKRNLKKSASSDVKDDNGDDAKPRRSGRQKVSDQPLSGEVEKEQSSQQQAEGVMDTEESLVTPVVAANVEKPSDKETLDNSNTVDPAEKPQEKSEKKVDKKRRQSGEDEDVTPKKRDKTNSVQKSDSNAKDLKKDSVKNGVGERKKEGKDKERETIGKNPTKEKGVGKKDSSVEGSKKNKREKTEKKIEAGVSEVKNYMATEKQSDLGQKESPKAKEKHILKREDSKTSKEDKQITKTKDKDSRKKDDTHSDRKEKAGANKEQKGSRKSEEHPQKEKKKGGKTDEKSKSRKEERKRINREGGKIAKKSERNSREKDDGRRAVEEAGKITKKLDRKSINKDESASVVKDEEEILKKLDSNVIERGDDTSASKKEDDGGNVSDDKLDRKSIDKDESTSSSKEEKREQDIVEQKGSDRERSEDEEPTETMAKESKMEEMEDGEVQDDDDDSSVRIHVTKEDQDLEKITDEHDQNKGDKVEGVRKGSLIIYKKDTSSKKVYAPVKTRRTSLKTKEKDDEKEGSRTSPGSSAPQRKRRWGSTKSHDTSKKKTNVNISTNMLKEMMPNIKEIQAKAEAEMETDAVISIDQELQDTGEAVADVERHKHRKVTLKQPTTKEDEEDKASSKEESDIDDGIEDGEEQAAKSDDNEMETDDKVKDQTGNIGDEDERKAEHKDASNKEREIVYSDDDDDDELSDIPLEDEEEEKAAKKKEIELRAKLTKRKTQIQDVLKASIDEPIRKSDQVTSSRFPSSKIIHVRNLVRPFTVGQLKTLIGRFGTLVDDGFWINDIKSHCFATFSSTEEAESCRQSLHGASWPQSNPKSLAIEFATQLEFDMHTKKATPTMMKKAAEPIPSLLRSMSPLKSRSRREEEQAKSERNKEREKFRERRLNEREQERKKPERPSERRLSEREWDRGKNKSPQEENRRPMSRERTRKDAKKSPEEPAGKLLDDLFNKTKATPCIYWLPLTEERIKEREEEMIAMDKEREERRKKRIEEIREREKERNRSRSPRRSSPNRLVGRNRGRQR